VTQSLTVIPGEGSIAKTYNKDAIHDANGSGYGGVPGIFKALTDAAGLDYDVTIEAVGGQSLEFHYNERSQHVRDGAPWDIVVLQEYSNAPTPSDRGGDPDLFARGSEKMFNLIREGSPDAKIYFYEAWARPDKVYKDDAPYQDEDIKTMQTDLHDAYVKMAGDRGATDVVLVGDGFMKAIDNGVGDINPYDGIDDGKVDMWADDHYHGSRFGVYLSACTFFATITGQDPTTIGNGDGSAAAGLDISSDIASKLQASVIWTPPKEEPEPTPTETESPPVETTPAPVPTSSCKSSARRRSVSKRRLSRRQTA